MFENLTFSLNAVLPLILTIFLGFFLKKIHLFEEEFIANGNKACYFFFIPLLLFYNIYNIENFNNIDFKVILFSLLCILILFIVGLFIIQIFVRRDKQKGVLLQCVFHSNYAIVGVPLAFALGGEEAVALVSIMSFFCIPFFNILAVIAFSVYEKDENNKISFKKIYYKIVRNPIIIGVFLGFLMLCFRFLLQALHIQFTLKENLSFLYITLGNIAKISSPLALIFLGAQFNFSGFKAMRKNILIGSSIRLIIVPALGLYLAYLFGFKGMIFPALIGIFATPLAVTVSSMSLEMKQDNILANNIIVWSSLFSTVSLFIIILICKSFALF